jgi:hypothetical protein
LETKDKHVTCEADDGLDHAIGTTTTIYIDPAREAAVRRKFDIYVVPVSVIYLVLSTLDRNNVSAHIADMLSLLISISLATLVSSASMKTSD